MNMLAYMMVGLIVGCISTSVAERNKIGALGDIIVGIVGALIGGFGFNRFGVTFYGIWDSLVSAAIGAVLLLITVRFLSGPRRSKNRLHKS